MADGHTAQRGSLLPARPARSRRRVVRAPGAVLGEFLARGAIVAGSVDPALGQLAATLERYEQAEAHFAAGAQLEQRLGARLFLARTHVRWGPQTRSRGRPEDLQRVQPMLDEAEETCERLGAGGVTRELAACRAALAEIIGQL